MAKRDCTDLQEFYCVKQQEHWDGVFLVDRTTRLEEKALHPVAVIAVNAQASLAAEGEFSRACMEKFWNRHCVQGTGKIL